MHRPAATADLTAAGRVAFAFLWLFVLSFPAEKAIMIPGIGSVAKLFGAAALGTGFLAVLIDRRIRTLSRTHALLALLAVWTAMTIRWSIWPEESAEKFTTLVQLLGMVWLVWEYCPSEERVRWLMRAYVFGTFYASFDTISRWLLARQTYYQRYAASGFDPNDLALTLAISLPLSYCLAVRSRGAFAAVYWVQMALAFLTVLLSASRTGFLTALIAATVAPLTFRYVSSRQRAAVCAGIAVAALAAAMFVPATSWKRLSTIGTEVSAGKLNARELIWSAGFRALRERPVEGVGTGAFPRSVEPVMGWPKGWLVVAHNTFLSVLVETGVVGFGLFFAFLAVIVVSVARMPGIDRVMWGVVLTVWAVGASTLTWEVRKPTWMIFALVLAQARLVRPAVYAVKSAALRDVRFARTREVALP